MLFFRNKITKENDDNLPIFLKDFNEYTDMLTYLYNLREDNKNKNLDLDLINKDIRKIRYGIDGEKAVFFELKNTFLPIYILHDIRLVYKEDYIAQFDFIVLTKSGILIIEVKNLLGDIIIDSNGDFYRKLNGNTKAIYNPLTQNQRHLNILRNMLISEKLLNNIPINSLVVFSNSKSILDKENAPIDIQEQLIKNDKLVEYLTQYTNSDTLVNKVQIEKIGKFLLKNNVSKNILINKNYFINTTDSLSLEDIQNDINTDELIELKLREYRTNIVKKVGVKPYCIFNNNELNLMVKHKPKKISDFTNIRDLNISDNYKRDIINIITSYN